MLTSQRFDITANFHTIAIMGEYIESAKRCRELRERLGLTQTEVAKRVNVTLRTWQNWEAGVTEPHGPAVIVLRDLEKSEKSITIAEKCQQLRDALMVTRAEMARRFNVQPNTWGYWESGTKTPSIKYRNQIDEMLVQVEKNKQ